MKEKPSQEPRRRKGAMDMVLWAVVIAVAVLIYSWGAIVQVSHGQVPGVTEVRSSR